jgi:hypothetical protein
MVDVGSCAGTEVDVDAGMNEDFATDPERVLQTTPVIYFGKASRVTAPFNPQCVAGINVTPRILSPQQVRVHKVYKNSGACRLGVEKNAKNHSRPKVRLDRFSPLTHMTQESSTEVSTAHSSSALQKHYRELHSECAAVMAESICSANEAKVARSHQLAQEIELWLSELGTRRESALLRVAAYEYQFALLALVQGHYRHAFKGLRLVLELTLQSVYLSAHELELREWLENRKDTIWAAVVDDGDGVFSARFVRCFFPTLESQVGPHGAIAKKVYRECSECVHGNIPKHIPLPQSLAFSQAVFDLWHAKADVVALLVHFVLVMRYLQDVPQDSRQKLEVALLSRVGHVQEIRLVLGGPTGS